MWRRRKWRQLLSVLEFLPRTSAYAEAIANDEELAVEVLKIPQDDRKAKWGREHRDYTPEVEMLSALFDRLGELIRVTAQSRGARVSKAGALAPRPVNAIERVHARDARSKHDRLAARLLKRSPPPSG